MEWLPAHGGVPVWGGIREVISWGVDADLLRYV